MARPGRKPKPTALKLLHGNPGRRRLPGKEPKPRPCTPEPPEWLDPMAKREWERIVPALAAIGLLTEVDGFVLESYCQCYARWVEHELAIAKIGTVYSPGKKKGLKYLKALPHVAIAQAYLAQARAFAEQLGLSPSARSRIDYSPTGGGVGENDDLD
jgi:P27 family predicted phage terminase small subunit